MGSEGGGKVYLTFHKSFVREGVPYVDRDTGEGGEAPVEEGAVGEPYKTPRAGR